MKKVSISDIAQKAGVSVSTVSFVMNDKAVKMRISQEVISRVERVAKEMGYRPNQLARGLRTGKTRTIGLIVEDIANAFFARLAKTIEDEAKNFDYRVVYCSTDNDEVKARELINMLSQRQVDGYIVTPTLHLADEIRKLQDEGIPVILVDRYFPQYDDIPYVLVDNYGGVSEGMEYLIAKGYRKIGLVTIEAEMAHMKDRMEAYFEALKRHDIPSDPDLVKSIPYEQSHVRESALQDIMEFLTGNMNRLDAVFFLTNYLGVLGIEAIKRSGIRVPADMSVLCFDDNDVFKLYTPTISVIRQPIAEIGRRAILALIEGLNRSGKEASEITPIPVVQVKLSPELIARESI